MLAGLVKNPTGYDPTNSPERGAQAPQRGARPDGRAERDHRPAGGQDQGHQARAPRRSAPRTAASTPGPRSSATTCSTCSPTTRSWARRSRSASSCCARAASPSTPRSTSTCRRPRTSRSPATSTRPTARSAAWRWSSPAPATSGHWPSRGRWDATAQAGQTYLNYVVPKEYGDSGGFQAGSTFKAFVLAAAIKQGIPLNTSIYAPQSLTLNQGSFRTCDGNYPSTQAWAVAELHRRGHLQPLHGHPAVGEHVLRPARAGDRPLRAVQAGARHGHHARRSRTRGQPDGAVVHPRRREHQPARDGRGLRDLRRPRRPLRRPAR